MALPTRLRCLPEERLIIKDNIKARARLDEASRVAYPAPSVTDESLEGALRYSVWNLFLDRPAFFLCGVAGLGLAVIDLFK